MIGRLFRRRTETRSTGGYTNLVLAGIDSRVAGKDADALVTGAVEVCAGLWGRTLAAATVEGTDALTARVLNRIGRDLIRVGESVFEVRADNGDVRLIAAGHWEVLEGWRYKLDLYFPPGRMLQRTVPREGVAHFKWAESAREPWRGLSPLADASTLSKLIGRAEGKLAEDLNTPTACLLPVPEDGGDGGDNDPLASLKADIGKGEGAVVTVQSTRTWAEDEGRAAPRHDWKGERLGPMVPATLIEAYREITASVAGACGIPPGLVMGLKVDGTLAREQYRRFVMASAEPVASMIAADASEALDADVSFDFSGLWAHDLVGRASTFQKLVAGGMDLERAVAVSGLVVADE